ncbi:hypothetical protein [Paraburkholderia sp. BCC1884]|uniref:hypothetical protein n=1 Tax=Paraburkholderia sp. BCC1884 TaxID=2562668 RepID=UPI001182D62E|nr:hypothetical protein [Paraburkholderia sp. BCC1884]
MHKPNELDRMRLSAIGAKAQQLEALLNMCYGAGFEQFNCLIKELQDSALELAAELAGEINRIARGAEHA